LALVNGLVYGWGFNGATQRPISGATGTPVNSPFLIPGITGVYAISAGFAHSLALLPSGQVYGWGFNTNYEVSGSTGVTGVVNSPFLIPGITGATAIYAGYNYSLALTSAGQVYGWGINTDLQISSAVGGNTAAAPFLIPGLNNVLAIAANVSGNRNIPNISGGSSTSLALLQSMIPVPCFVKDTPVVVDSGIKLIQDISNIDYINGYKVHSVTYSAVYKDECNLVLFKKNSLGYNTPDQDTVCTKYHNIIVNGNLFAAEYLINNSSIVNTTVAEGTLVYHVLLDDNKWSFMNVNNLLADTLCPDNLVAQEQYKIGSSSSNLSNCNDINKVIIV